MARDELLAEADRTLRRVFEWSDSLASHIDSAAKPWPVQLGSSLSGDDKASRPFQVSHTVQRLIHASSDNLATVRALILGRPDQVSPDSGSLHVFGDYTLARGAIETALLAKWVLQPAQRRERVARCLKLAQQDAHDARQATVAIAEGSSRARYEDLSRMVANVAQRNQIEPPGHWFPLSRALAEAAVDSDMDLLTAWRICSGMAHGRLWSQQMLSEMTETGGDEQVATVRVQGRIEWLAVMLSVAHITQMNAVELYMQRAARH